MSATAGILGKDGVRRAGTRGRVEITGDAAGARGNSLKAVILASGSRIGEVAGVTGIAGASHQAINAYTVAGRSAYALNAGGRAIRARDNAVDTIIYII